MREAIINNGIANCPNCGYPHEAQPGEIIPCENGCEKFRAISNEPPPKKTKGVPTGAPLKLFPIYPQAVGHHGH